MMNDFSLIAFGLVMGYALALRFQLRGALVLLLCCFAFGVTGCASVPSVPHEVKVPVNICPVVEVPPRPALPISSLPRGSAPADNARAVAQSLEALTAHVEHLETLLAPFNKNKSTK